MWGLGLGLLARDLEDKGAKRGGLGVCMGLVPWACVFLRVLERIGFTHRLLSSSFLWFIFKIL